MCDSHGLLQKGYWSTSTTCRLAPLTHKINISMCTVYVHVYVITSCNPPSHNCNCCPFTRIIPVERPKKGHIGCNRKFSLWYVLGRLAVSFIERSIVLCPYLISMVHYWRLNCISIYPNDSLTRNFFSFYRLSGLRGLLEDISKT